MDGITFDRAKLNALNRCIVSIEQATLGRTIMTKMEAIKRKCLDCAGGTRIDVTLCHVFSCPLWEYRCGCLTRSKPYKARLETAKRKHPEILEELKNMGIDTSQFE